MISQVMKYNSRLCLMPFSTLLLVSLLIGHLFDVIIWNFYGHCMRQYVLFYILLLLIGYVSQNSMVPVTMSLHLSEVPETSAAYVTFYSKLVTVLSLVLFEVPYFSCMILGMNDQICFPHEASSTSSCHTHMGFYFFVLVFDFVSVQITFKWVIFSTFFTYKFVPSSMHIPVSL